MTRWLSICLTLVCLSPISGLAQESRPTSRPTSQTSRRSSKPVIAKKWVDQLASPIKLGNGGEWAEYGSSIKMKAQTSLKAVANNPEAFKERKVMLRGRIQSICVKKGCWIRMKDQGENIFVKFKDYAFFAPRHLSGHDVILEGFVSYEIVKEAERKHMAGDAGKSPDEIALIKGDKTELRMMADAMRIITPPQKAAQKIILVGKHSVNWKPDPLAKIMASPKKYLGRDIAVRGQITSATATSLTIESDGERLVLKFANPRPSEALIEELKKKDSPSVAQGFGRLEKVGATYHLVTKTAAITY